MNRFIHVWLSSLVLSGCVTSAPVVAVDSVAAGPRCPAGATGRLVVYSTTYAQTLEQSEYPAHTSYTVATGAGSIIRHVANNTGSFGASPATVHLECGRYLVRAQYGSGRFAVIPVDILADKTTIVDLDGEPLSLDPTAPKQPIRLPDGDSAGWSATIGSLRTPVTGGSLG